MAKVATMHVPALKGAKMPLLTVPISNIKNKFDVRQVLDDDRIIYLAELYESGVEVDPIKVIKIKDATLESGETASPGTQLFAYVDGRHRAQARALLNLPTIEAFLIDDKDADMVELLASSLKSNYGGPKPPTREDIRLTIRRMLEAGGKFPRIRDELSFIPVGMLRKYMADVQSNLNKHRLVQALNAVADGAKPADAAIQYDVDLDTLKDAITGQRKRVKSTGALQAEYRAYITQQFRSANRGIAGKMAALLQKVQDGEMTIHSAEDIVNSWETTVTGSLSRIKDWRDRVLQVADSLAARPDR